MKKIDLKKLIEDNDLCFDDLADALFPGSNHPDLGLKRLMKGDGNLYESQIVALSEFTGLSIAELYEEPEKSSWHARKTGDTYTFTKGDYEAVIDWTSQKVSFRHKGAYFGDPMLIAPAIKVPQLMREFDEIISNHK